MEKGKKIPKAVIEAAKGLGTEIVFEHRKRGYDVYSVGMKCKEDEIILPTGLPNLILFKDNIVRTIAGVESFDWL